MAPNKSAPNNNEIRVLENLSEAENGKSFESDDKLQISAHVLLEALEILNWCRWIPNAKSGAQRIKVKSYLYQIKSMIS